MLAPLFSLLFIICGGVAGAQSHHHKPSSKVTVVPHGSIHISIGGISYWISNDKFYRYDDRRGYHTVGRPGGYKPNQKASLPRGAREITHNGERYWSYRGQYYKHNPRRGYEIVTLPPKKSSKWGFKSKKPAKVHYMKSLPRGSKTVVVRGKKYWTHGGRYYQHASKHGYYEVARPR